MRIGCHNCNCEPIAGRRGSGLECWAARQAFMKIRVIVWISSTVILCLASFRLGWLSHPRPSYNPVPLADDLMDNRAVLTNLRAGDSTNAMQSLEAILDLEIYDAIRQRPSLQVRDRKILDKVLVAVARYREQFPRPIASTNGLALDSAESSSYKKWVAEQEQIDAFLHDFAKQQP